MVVSARPSRATTRAVAARISSTRSDALPRPNQPGSAEVGVVVISGVASGTVGSGGAAHSDDVSPVGAAAWAGALVSSEVISHSVDVCPVVISDVVTGPGGAGSGSAVLTSLNKTPCPARPL